jgi:HTH-type transcriptional regulator/antitoxin HigA
MIKPIRNKSQHKKALARIAELMGKHLTVNSAEYDELEVLSLLVEDYEEKKFAIAPPDPIEAILFRMEQMGMDAKALAEILGSKSRASEILNRKRKLSLSMIRTLHHNLNIPAELLIRAY